MQPHAARTREVVAVVCKLPIMLATSQAKHEKSTAHRRHWANFIQGTHTLAILIAACGSAGVAGISGEQDQLGPSQFEIEKLQSSLNGR